MFVEVVGELAHAVDVEIGWGEGGNDVADAVGGRGFAAVRI